MKQQYLTEFHRRNSEACMAELKANERSPLSVEDVLAQARTLGRTSIRVIASEKDDCIVPEEIK